MFFVFPVGEKMAAGYPDRPYGFTE